MGACRSVHADAPAFLIKQMTLSHLPIETRRTPEDKYRIVDRTGIGGSL